MDPATWLLVIVLLMVVVSMVLPSSRGLTRRVARVEQKIDLILKQMGIQPDVVFPGLSDRVKELARDPSRKIEAIRVYREETGAGLAEAKEAVESWIEADGSRRG